MVEPKKGEVYIGSFNMRGSWAVIPDDFVKLNVTSCQKTTNPERIAFSPMSHKNGYKGFHCFENYWQSMKFYDIEEASADHKKEEDHKKEADHKKRLVWWKNQKEGKRRFPLSKGKLILYALHHETGEKLNYIESRKKVYVPEYYNLIKDEKVLNEYKKILNSGKSICIFDIDGPRDENGNVTYKKVTKELLFEKLHDEKFPFGHGYIVASILANLDEYLLGL